MHRYKMKEHTQPQTTAWGDQRALFERKFKPIFQEQGAREILDVPLLPSNSLVVNLNFMESVINQNVSP